MNKFFNYFAIALVAAVLMTGAAFGQTLDSERAANGFASMQAVNDSESMTPRTAEKSERPIGRAQFVKRVTVNLNGSGVNVVAMQIPAGKRLVIENVSAIVRSPESQRVEVNYYTYTNNNGAASRTVNELALEKQASFKDSAIFTTRRSVSVFADERIGSEHYSIGISARLSGGVAAQYAQAQFTFSGYLEDLPAI